MDKYGQFEVKCKKEMNILLVEMDHLSTLIFIKLCKTIPVTV